MIEVDEHGGLIHDVIRHLFGGMAKAHKIANTRGMDVEDLIQIGFLAMCEAAQQYDSNLGEWSTYAFHCIRGAILKKLNNSFPLKMPVKMSMEEKIKKSRVESLFKEYKKDDEQEMLLIDSIPSEEEPFTNELLVKNDFEMKVNRILTKKEKDVLFKRVYNDLTHQQIASQVGCSRRNVTILLNNALSKLAKAELVS